MFDDADDITALCSKRNPKAKVKKTASKKVAPVVSRRVDPPKPKPSGQAIQKTPPKTAQARPETEKKNVQDIAGQFSSAETTVFHKTGDYYWTIQDGEKLSDHQIFCYFYKRLGFRAHELEIVRPKVS